MPKRSPAEAPRQGVSLYTLSEAGVGKKGRKEERKEGRKERRKEGRKEGKKRKSRELRA